VSAPDRASSDDKGSDAARAHLEAEVDAALAPYAGKLSAADLAWVRERLIEGAAEDEAVTRLLRAALPRDVDQSGEVFYPSKTPR
jgi:hypothetical protein